METLSKESLSLLESLIQTGSSSFGDGIAERITDYLEQNLEQNVSLDMLAPVYELQRRLSVPPHQKEYRTVLQRTAFRPAFKKIHGAFTAYGMRINDIGCQIRLQRCKLFHLYF